ncbi:uncharacterized protein LOC141590967 [Silene latifolia]|uniref:uncharacterized protein LOC141590967 n=1 Tax=Silene latifolia TaxID=37657 RepID=UPI003D7774C8
MMKKPHADCSKECLQCVLDWYSFGSSDDEFDESKSVLNSPNPNHNESPPPNSPPPTTCVPDSLSPDDLGTQVGETEFDDLGFCVPYTPRHEEKHEIEVGAVVDDVCRSPVDDVRRSPLRSPLKLVMEPQSPASIKYDAIVARYTEHMKNKRLKVEETVDVPTVDVTVRFVEESVAFKTLRGECLQNILRSQNREFPNV